MKFSKLNFKHNNLYLFSVFVGNLRDLFSRPKNYHFFSRLVIAPIDFFSKFLNVFTGSNIVLKNCLINCVSRCEDFINKNCIVFPLKLVFNIFSHLNTISFNLCHPCPISAAQITDEIFFLQICKLED